MPYDEIAERGEQLGFPRRTAQLDAVLSAGAVAIEHALDAGVRVGLGSDLLGETHPAQSKELLLQAEVQSPLEVLRWATLVNAELLGKAGELGVIAPARRPTCCCSTATLSPISACSSVRASASTSSRDACEVVHNALR